MVAHAVPGGYKVGIATARHVFDDPIHSWHPRELHVRFAAEENQTFSEDVGYPITLLEPSGASRWLAIEGNDVAVIGLTNEFARGLPPGLLTDGIGDQDFATENDLFEGEAVLLFGFPGDTQVLMGPNILVRAVTRAGVVAWTNPQTPLDNPSCSTRMSYPEIAGGLCSKFRLA